jgi:hypothetical protein
MAEPLERLRTLPLLRAGRRRHDPQLLIHRQEVETVPAFSDLAVDNSSDGDAFEIDFLPGGWEAQCAAVVCAGHSAVRGDEITFADGALDHDADVRKGAAERVKYLTEARRTAHLTAR